jgi:methyl-accepting chemotaxis protein
MAAQYKRRNYFIDKKFQTKFMLRFSLIVIISSLLIIGFLFYFSQGSTTVAIEDTKVVVKGTADFILPLLIGVVLITTLLAAVSVLVLAMFSSHKIAGPLFRVQREIKEFAKGDLTRSFRIRGDDQLQELSNSLEDMGQSLRQNQGEIKENYQKFKEVFDKQKDNLSEPAKLRISQILEKLDSKMDFFKT